MLAACAAGCKRTAPPGASAKQVQALSYLPTTPAVTADGQRMGVTLRTEQAFGGEFIACDQGQPPDVVAYSAMGERLWRVELPDGPNAYTGCLTVAPHPSGDLIVMGPWSLMRVGRSGALRWIQKGWELPADTYTAHHDFYVDDAGDVVALAHRLGHRTVDGRERELLVDAVVRIDGNSGALLEVLTPLFDLLAPQLTDEDYSQPEEAFPRYARAPDPLHPNSLYRVREAAPPMAAGDVLIGLIRGRAIAAIRDVEGPKASVSWLYTRPHPPVFPHTPSITRAGTVLYYDNGYPRRRSGVIELDPISRVIVRTHTHKTMFDPFCGSVQELPNGSWLVTETARGRVQEIDPQGLVTWEFLYPFADDAHRHRAVACRGRKADKAWPLPAR